jgi:thiol-disulfide isomerase/thioredoxin
MKRLFVAALAALLPPMIMFGAVDDTGRPKAPPQKPAAPVHVSRGQPVKLTDYLIPGKTVVFDFYSDYCGACVQLAPALKELHRKREDVVVVKVDVNRPGVKAIDWDSPVVRQYGLHSLPHLKVYGPTGSLIAEDVGPQLAGRRLVLGWLQQ